MSTLSVVRRIYNSQGSIVTPILLEHKIERYQLNQKVHILHVLKRTSSRSVIFILNISQMATGVFILEDKRPYR